MGERRSANTVEVHPADSDSWPRLQRIDELAFGFTWPETGGDIHRDVLELDRTLIATIGGHDAGIASTYSLEMSVPGAPRQPVAGLTWVGVLPTHRRRGVLTALMRHHLNELHDQTREPVAALFASEPSIYGRFGYGPASQRLSIRIPREFARLTTPPEQDDPRPEFADADQVRPQLALVADAVAMQRPGLPARSPIWWDRTFDDQPGDREGFSALRTLLVADESGPRGYAIYSTKESWGPGGSKGELGIREIAATDPAAHRALWRVLLDTDLMGEVVYGMLPIDDPLLHQLVDPRRIQATVGDALFARLVDVDRALTSRTYASAIDVVLDLDDPFCPWNTGRWHLSGDSTGATCAPTTQAPDLALDARVAGAVYLGGTSLRGLADAGLVTEHRLGAVDATSRALLSARAPWCPFVF